MYSGLVKNRVGFLTCGKWPDFVNMYTGMRFFFTDIGKGSDIVYQ